MPREERPDSRNEVLWRERLTEGHRPLRLAQRLFRRLPSPPRCKLCHNPFGGIGGKIVGLLGFAPSRKNPNLCNLCFDRLPPGGAEIDIAILFADLRDSTTLGERSAPAKFAATMNRFYSLATDVLVRHDAVIDKFIGDEVMALFIPGFCGPDYPRRSAEAAFALLAADTGLTIRGSVNSGVVFVGNVGSAGVVDFTALGDPVNTAARLCSEAGSGEFLISETVYRSVDARFPDLDRRTLELRGKDEPVQVRVLRQRPGERRNRIP